MITDASLGKEFFPKSKEKESGSGTDLFPMVASHMLYHRQNQQAEEGELIKY